MTAPYGLILILKELDMPQTIKRTNELLEKANELPLLSGVYIMKDRGGKVIYVGKSRKLKNRVSQYFQNSQKNAKTSRMVYFAEDFDFIICKTEIEALTLENTLIKQYSPKYNIKLKDAKSYPYIKITNEEYPRIAFTRSRAADKAKYYGPFTGSSTAYALIDILHKSLGIPSCKRKFPQDIGKSRPCLYYQIGQCCGLCTGNVTKKEYLSLIKCATDILKGNTAESKKKLSAQMIEFAEAEYFEAAAKCRDTIEALDALHQKQTVVASPDTEMDVFGLWQNECFSCISCAYVRGGAVIDKSDFVFGAETEMDGGALCAFLVEHYKKREGIPKEILTSFRLDFDDVAVLEEYFGREAGRRVSVRTPERGNKRTLCATVVSNAEQKVKQSTKEAEKDEGVTFALAKLLELESVPERIEAYDISNIGKENITAGMVVYKNGKRSKGDYRAFNIKMLNQPDDYASMRDALSRRIKHLEEDTTGSFSEYPDLILVDGGRGHVSVAKEVLFAAGLDIPVFGMVKDDFHKTRALCTDTQEINIAKDRTIFTFIYGIQEEVHRFTVGKTTRAKSATLTRSSLREIPGIGEAKARRLLIYFGTLSRLKEASRTEICKVSGIGEKDANAIYSYFHKNEEDGDIYK